MLISLKFILFFWRHSRQMINLAVDAIAQDGLKIPLEFPNADSYAEREMPHPGYVTTNGMGSLEIGATHD